MSCLSPLVDTTCCPRNRVKQPLEPSASAATPPSYTGYSLRSFFFLMVSYCINCLQKASSGGSGLTALLRIGRNPPSLSMSFCRLYHVFQSQNKVAHIPLNAAFFVGCDVFHRVAYGNVRNAVSCQLCHGRDWADHPLPEPRLQ
jgi:hypothetical protein